MEVKEGRRGDEIVRKMGAGKVGGEDRGGAESRNGRMSVQYEKEKKEEVKGGHIVESRPGFLFVHSADKSLFVAVHSDHFSPSLFIHCLLNMFLHDVARPYSCSRMHIKHAI